jgi:hypothetical protein
MLVMRRRAEYVLGQEAIHAAGLSVLPILPETLSWQRKFRTVSDKGEISLCEFKRVLAA